MATRSELIAHVTRLGNVVRSAQLKRALTSVDPNPTLNFWRLVYGNLLDVAVLEWCKLFGADSEPTHWKRVVSDHDSFRRALRRALGIDEAKWADYWEEMKAYRDALVAHHVNSSSVTRYPSLDLCLESCYFYYAHVIKELRSLGEVRFPDDLKEYSARFASQAKEIAERALASTGDIQESVF
jgi:hypothetical protein